MQKNLLTLFDNGVNIVSKVARTQQKRGDKMKKYGKLRELIKTKFEKNDDFAEAMDLNPSTLSKKLNGRASFTGTEIECACNLLEIPKEQIHEYFFYL